jgi:hypothetical protein
MRTTLSIDDDVLDQARVLAERRHQSFRSVVNEAMRTGLALAETPAPHQRYRTKARPMGLRPGHNLDNVQELLAQIEGEDAR